MSLGKYVGGGLALALLGTGILITYMQMQGLVSKGIFSWTEWPGLLLATATPWGSLLVVFLLLGLGLFYRGKPHIHKRYLTLATVGLATAATLRMDYLLGFQSKYILESIGVAMMVIPLFTYDLYTDRRIQWPTLIGTGIIYTFIGVRAARSFLG